MRPYYQFFASTLLASTMACSAWAQTGTPSKNQVQTTPGNLTPYAQNAQRNGITTCLGRINQITNFVVGKNTHQGIMQTPPKDKMNQAIVTSTIALDLGNATSLVSTNFAPSAAGAECSGSYEAVTYWNSSCTQVAKTSFPTMQANQSLLQRVAVLESKNTALKVFLMPAGSGCISIKKEVLY